MREVFVVLSVVFYYCTCMSGKTPFLRCLIILEKALGDPRHGTNRLSDFLFFPE